MVDHDATQHRYLRIGVNKGNVGVPLVGTSSALPESSSRIDDVPLIAPTVGCGTSFAESDSETFLLRIVEMVLVAKEDNLVLEQHFVDCAIVSSDRSPDNLMFLISAPSRAARLTISARG